MFTGLITDIGEIIALDGDSSGTEFGVKSSYETNMIQLGDSIAHDGCCLTVTKKRADNDFAIYHVQAVPDTLKRTILKYWALGTRVNLERSLKVGDELGGHFVYGHVDATCVLIKRQSDGNAIRCHFSIPTSLSPYIVPKGSIALNGVSLTVADVKESSFVVNIIPHTASHTTFAQIEEADKLNLEVDMMARYVERQLAYRHV